MASEVDIVGLNGLATNAIERRSIAGMRNRIAVIIVLSFLLIGVSEVRAQDATIDEMNQMGSVASCCVGTRGNVNGDMNEVVDLADLLFLVSHLYLDKQPVDCQEEANINGDSLGINMADMAMLIDHLFFTFSPLPGCGFSGSSIGLDNGNSDTLRLVVSSSQKVGNDLKIAVQLWIYNDMQNVVGAEAGFSWNSPDLRMDSVVETNLADAAFGLVGELSFNNTSRQFQFADIRVAGQGLVQSTTAKHVATYFMTYSNWGIGDIIAFDTVRVDNTGYGFVDSNNLMWMPKFVSQGLVGVVTEFSVAAIGGASVDVSSDPFTGDAIWTISNLGISGNDGVAITVPFSDPFVGMETSNIDLSLPDISLTLDVNANTSIPTGSMESARVPQSVGSIRIATLGGQVELSADFNSIGDPDIQYAIYFGPVFQDSASIPGGGVVATGSDPGLGLPEITSITYSGEFPIGYTIDFDRGIRFSFSNGANLVGDKIRIMAPNATSFIDFINTMNVTASGLSFFTLRNATTSRQRFCCLGFTGNIDGDSFDKVDISDLTFLIDHMFINFTRIDCPGEGNVDGDASGIVDIGDLTRLIDHLFINFPPTAVCQ